jgi:hypothetical protein
MATTSDLSKAKREQPLHTRGYCTILSKEFQIPDQLQPGLISYDSYWEFLQGNAVLRSVPEIRNVIDVSKVVENRVQQAFTRKALQPMAERDYPWPVDSQINDRRHPGQDRPDRRRTSERPGATSG